LIPPDCSLIPVWFSLNFFLENTILNTIALNENHENVMLTKINGFTII